MGTKNSIPIGKATEFPKTIHLSPLTATLGAEVSGLNLANGVPDSVKPLLKQALLEYQILLFPRQFLDDEQQIRFARLFGPCREMWQAEHYRSTSKFIHYLSNVDRDGVPVGAHPDRDSTYWHTDGSHVPVPAKATVLNAVRVSEDAGRTHFASMYQLYDSLDQATRDRIANYEAEHHLGFRRAARHKRMPWQWRQARKEGKPLRSQLEWWTTVLRRRWQEGPVYHPVVRAHPETGRLALFVGDHAWRVRGKPWPTGVRLMNEIHALDLDRDSYVHRWRSGDLLIWDNGSLLHRVGEYDLVKQVRIMRRCVVLGSE